MHRDLERTYVEAELAGLVWVRSEWSDSNPIGPCSKVWAFILRMMEGTE